MSLIMFIRLLNGFCDQTFINILIHINVFMKLTR